jgi:hypothetical protein
MCSSSESIVTSEYIMNQIHLVARLAQGLLAVTIVFAIGLVFQLTTIVS